MSYYRTPEHRAMRAELIRRWKPWEKSTGPKTDEVKARSAMRGYKGGARGRLREQAAVLKPIAWRDSDREGMKPSAGGVARTTGR